LTWNQKRLQNYFLLSAGPHQETDVDTQGAKQAQSSDDDSFISDELETQEVIVQYLLTE